MALRAVSKSFGKVVALDDLSLDVHDGEFLVLLGPSGCGKTTALRLIAGLETPSSGEILIGDRPVSHLSPKDRDIAMVFQNYALYPHMSVFDNMAFGLAMRKLPRPEIDRRVRETASMLEIDHLLNRKPRELSGGQRQRVALARAIVREPQAFLMDEPLSNLDAQLRVQTRGELVKLQRRLGATVIYVTHDQTEAMSMADRVVVLRDGQLQQVDPPQAVYDLPRNRFVASFVGSPGMNFFNGRVVDSGGAKRIECDILQVALASPTGESGQGRQDEACPALATDQKVIVGIRPEDLLPLGGDGETFTASIRAAVDVVESLGNEKLLHFVASDVEFVARVDPRVPAAMGDEMTLGVRPGRVHLFDHESGVRLGGAPI